MRLVRSKLSDLFDRTPRSVRVMAEDDFLIVDVIPSVLSDRVTLTDTSDPLWKVRAGSREIIQDTKLLRIKFDFVLAYYALREGAEAGSEWHNDIWRIIREDISILPIFSVDPSPWKDTQPDWRYGDNPDVKHDVIASETMLIDVLASVDSYRWMPNTRMTIDSWYDEELPE